MGRSFYSKAFRMPARIQLLLILLLTSSLAFASGPYTIGSSNSVTADPTITRSTTSGVVQLLNNAEFDNFNPVSFNYAPPADCPGPWAMVVFTADINVTAGIQYDRTANFWLGPTAIYFGTTAEPSPALGSSQLYNNSDSTGVNQVCILTVANNALTSFSPTCSQ